VIARWHLASAYRDLLITRGGLLFRGPQRTKSNFAEAKFDRRHPG
jgi:hypothetical protein